MNSKKVNLFFRNKKKFFKFKKKVSKNFGLRILRRKKILSRILNQKLFYRIFYKFGISKKIDDRKLINRIIIKINDRKQLKANTIEHGRLLIRKLKKKPDEFQTRIFPFLACMKRPSDVRMGKGKCFRINKYIYPTKLNKVLYTLNLSTFKEFNLSLKYRQEYNSFKDLFMKFKKQFLSAIKIFRLRY